MTNFISQIKQIWNSATQRVISITGIGMLIALVVDMLLASRLGTSMSADALIIALTLPRWIEIVVREGAKFSLVAHFVEVKANISNYDYLKFVNSLLNMVFLFGLIFTVMSWFLAPLLVTILGPGLPAEGKTLASWLFRLAAPMTMFALGSTVLGIFLNSQQHFAVVSTRNGVAPAIVAITIVLVWDNPQITLWIAGAYTVGYALFFGLLLIYSVSRLGLRPNLKEWPNKETLQSIIVPVAYPTLGYGARQGVRILERMLASLAFVGGVSAYYFSWRIYSAAQTIIGTSFATTAVPSMTELALADKKAKISQFLSKRLFRVLVLSLPLALLMIFFSEPIIRILYGRGEFSDASVKISANVLSWLGTGFIFACIVPLLLSTVYAIKDIKGAFKVIIRVSILNVILAIPLSIQFGLIGLAIAASMTSLFSCLLLVVHLRKSGIRLRGIN
jgi:putative peptidoglycan lipid II flippase